MRLKATPLTDSFIITVIIERYIHLRLGVRFLGIMKCVCCLPCARARASIFSKRANGGINDM